MEKDYILFETEQVIVNNLPNGNTRICFEIKGKNGFDLIADKMNRTHRIHVKITEAIPTLK